MMNAHRPHPLLAKLIERLGAARVMTDPDSLGYYSQDYFREAEGLLAAVKPANRDDLAAALRCINAAGLAVYPRGAGYSYTEGYLPTRPGVCLDLTDLNRIETLDTEDMYVVVEAGCTWAALDAALQAKGLRTPFFGPMSGLHSTVGGAVSQHALGMGSARFGASARSVLALEVLDSEGQALRTGAWTDRRSPFFREYGPDLTGLFCGDCGALGIKTRIALPLMARPTEVVGLSFGFDSLDALVAGNAAVARLGVAADSNSMSAQAVLDAAQGQPLRQELKTLWQVASNGSSLLSGIGRAGRIALSGRRFAAGYAQTAHFAVEGANAQTVRGHAQAVRAAVAPFGQEIPATVPVVLRAAPFQEYDMLAPTGQRQLPPNTVLPFSQVASMARAFEAEVTALTGTDNPHGLGVATMFSIIGTTAMLCEPVITWNDAPGAFHRRHTSAATLKLAEAQAPNLEARSQLLALRERFVELAQQHGGTHLQIGKAYPYLSGRDARYGDLMRELKQHIDPNDLLNPGALGLGNANLTESKESP
ncbi:MAG: FAD-binding oxidoreductase [Pseudomonadota bacterium]